VKTTVAPLVVYISRGGGGAGSRVVGKEVWTSTNIIINLPPTGAGSKLSEFINLQ
jgi:hypothetical protein